MSAQGIELARIIAGDTHAPVVYFLTVGDRVKIGTSKCLRSRISSLSMRLAQVAVIVPGGVDVEHEFHERFADYRIWPEREWFWLRGRLSVFVGREPVVRGSRRLRSVAPESDGCGPVSVSEAMSLGLLDGGRAALVKRLQRDPRSPAPVGYRGRARLYAREDLVRWAESS